MSNEPEEPANEQARQLSINKAIQDGQAITLIHQLLMLQLLVLQLLVLLLAACAVQPTILPLASLPVKPAAIPAVPP